MTDNDKSFWTTVPGILTGIAAVISAMTGLYVAMNRPGAPTVRESEPPPAAVQSAPVPSPSQWPLVGMETFDEVGSHWFQGAIADDGMTGEAGIGGGKYRWTVQFMKSWERPQVAPYEPATDFYLAVDLRMLEYEAWSGAGLLFGRNSGTDYTFVISSDKKFIVKRFDGTVDQVLIDWTPVNIDPGSDNHIAVVVENERIQLFINARRVGEFREPSFKGGKVGVVVTGWTPGHATVELDNLEFRRKPDQS